MSYISRVRWKAFRDEKKFGERKRREEEKEIGVGRESMQRKEFQSSVFIYYYRLKILKEGMNIKLQNYHKYLMSIELYSFYRLVHVRYIEKMSIELCSF